MNRDKLVSKTNTDTITSTLQSLGFTINEKKSVLVPTQKIIFFGFIIDSANFKVYLTEGKVQKIIIKAHSLLTSRTVVIRDLASFIGLLVSTFHAILEAPLHYRSLERDKVLGLGSEMNYDNNISLSDGIFRS